MCFGLTNAPRTFQRAMDTILHGLPFVKVYLDDILVFSEDLQQHCQHLKQTLQRLKSHGASINLEKSCFALEKIEYLGHYVSSEGISPMERGIEKLSQFTLPKTVKQM